MGEESRRRHGVCPTDHPSPFHIYLGTMTVYPSGPPPDAADFLAEVSIFAGLENRLLSDIAGQMEWCHVHGGSILFRQGEEGDALYVVVSGRLRVLLERPDGPGISRTLREVTRGETVGELALINGEPRSATVVALRDTELGRISRETFTRLLEREPRSVLGLTRMLGWWLTHPPAPESSSPTTVALVPLGRRSPLDKVASRLAAALSRLGKTLHLNSLIVDRIRGAGTSQLGDRDAAYQEVTRWLNDQEADYRFILYESDLEYSPWTIRCISQADRILQVGSSSDESEPDGVYGPRGSGASIGGAADQELVLVHTTDPHNTARWLNRASFTTHHHLRADRDADYDRLARHLGGEAVGLVLGGGGARGFAHIGVIKALEELKIPIDRLGGTSMGAVIAAQYAGGLSAAQMIDLNRRGWVGFKPHRDFTLPMISLLSGRAAGRMLKMMFGDREIEDLWLNYYCVSTNLSRAELMVHRRGPVRRWVRASISLPGSAPPLIGDHGDLLIDGGVLDNVPVGVMQQMGESRIIAVDVSPDVDLVVDTGMKLAPTPWILLRDRFRPNGDRRKFPSLFQILYRTSVLSSIRSGKERRDGVAAYLEPPTSAFDSFEMSSIDAIVEVGYRYTMEQLTSGTITLPGRPV
jgi:predicted acylesterase/phospholipase RssA/CRP-like cAMP-binding protein